MSIEEIAERFARDTEDFTVRVQHEDGLYRHLTFGAPYPSFYWFDLITTPHRLVFSGDGHTPSFVFGHAADMFEFFREYGRSTADVGYLSDQLTSGRVWSFSEEKFTVHVTARLKAAERLWPGVTQAWQATVKGDAAEYNTELESDAQGSLSSFYYRPDGSTGEWFHFTHGTDYGPGAWSTFQDYDWWYLWACHAIVWGIGQYDKAREQVAS